jgi:Helix-turn-helix domain
MISYNNSTPLPRGSAPSLGDILVSTEQLQHGQRDAAKRSGPKVKSARSHNRAAAHAYDLAQWREYRLAMATCDIDREAIEAEYAKRLQAGPDFCHYRVGSDFSEPHRHDLDKAGKQAVLTAFDQVRAWLYRNQRKPHGQAVSRAYREVLSVLLSVAVKYGQCYPSKATIAKLACCSERTVDNAVQWLRTWGFLSYMRRIKRLQTTLGTIVRQSSNAYKLALSGLAAIGAGILGNGAGRNNCGPSQLTVAPIMQLARERQTERGGGR